MINYSNIILYLFIKIVVHTVMDSFNSEKYG